MTLEVYDRDGLAVTLGPPGPSGGEGTIHRVLDEPRSAAKIFHPHRLSDELHRKLLAMTGREPAARESIAWAKRILYRQDRSFCGFTMPLVDTDIFRQAHVYYDPEDRLRLFGGNFTWRHLLTAARNLATAVAALHAEGHRVGDLRETNVLVAPSALVTLIDCDSFQIADRASGVVYPTRVATGDYLPPELQGVDFRSRSPDRLHADRFALAVLIFRFLMLGVHPFQARGPRVADSPSTEAKIRAGLFPYGRRFGIAPPEYAPDYGMVPHRLRDLFSACFERGHDYPARRPPASEWAAALGAEAQRLTQCKTNPNHWHASRSCPWCARARREGGDPFPAPVPLQVALQAGERVPKDARMAELRTLVRVAVADGPLRPEETTYLRDQAIRLGIGGHLERIVDAELRARTPVAPPQDATRRAWSLGNVKLDLRTAQVAGPPVLAATAAAVAAPALAPLFAMLVVTPLAATAGQTLAEPAAGWRSIAMALPRFLSNLHRSLVETATAIPALGLAAAALAWAPPVTARLASAAFVLGWGWLILSFRRREPLGSRVLFAAGRLGFRLSHLPRVKVVAWCAGVAALAGAYVTDPIWWPLRAP